jgi:hypothetical protein
MKYYNVITYCLLFSLKLSLTNAAFAQNELSVNYIATEQKESEAPAAKPTINSTSGFKDLHFGRHLSGIKGLRLASTSGDKAIYTRPSDIMLIGNEPVERIEYHFYQDRFFGVVVTIKDQYHLQASLKSEAIKKSEHPFLTALKYEYGTPDFEQLSTLTWLDDQVMLQVRKSEETIEISYTDTITNELIKSESKY